MIESLAHLAICSSPGRHLVEVTAGLISKKQTGCLVFPWAKGKATQEEY
jgi:hypothetical protein